MKIRSMIVAMGLALASSTAFAFHCPADMKKIDAAMAKNPKLSAAQMSESEGGDFTTRAANFRERIRASGLLAALGELGVSATDAVYVGDRPGVDDAAAAAANMRCVLVGDAHRTSKAVSPAGAPVLEEAS